MMARTASVATVPHRLRDNSPGRRIAQHIPSAFANFFGLVLVGYHVRVRHERLRRALRCPLRHQVERVEPPVQGVRDNDRSEAHIAVNLTTGAMRASAQKPGFTRAAGRRTILQSAFKNATACATWLKPRAM